MPCGQPAAGVWNVPEESDYESRDDVHVATEVERIRTSLTLHPENQGNMALTGACLWAGRLRVTWRPVSPAFWSACGVPASHHRRGREVDD